MTKPLGEVNQLVTQQPARAFAATPDQFVLTLTSTRMRRFILVSLSFLAITFHVQLHAQGSEQPNYGAASPERVVISHLQFKDQGPDRQQHILAHPEQYKVLDNGTVEVYGVPSMNLVQDSPEQPALKQAPAQAENAKAPAKMDLPKQITAVEILSLPPAMQWMILEHQSEHVITKSELSQKEYDKLRPDQQKTIELNPNLFTIKQ
jgi:hypothetical protein